MKILFASQTEKAEVWLPLLRQALPDDELVAVPDKLVDVALVATPPAGTFQKLGRPKLVQSLWMGVEKLLADPTYPRGVPLARLIDPGMVAAMSETVLAYVLDWHRHLYQYRAQQRAHQWKRIDQRLASDRTVGLLGLGELGSDAARKLVALGFNVAGWSRRPKALPGVRSFTDLQEMLRITDALVCLLPLTRETTGILNARTFAYMRRGGCVINLARGGHLVSRDLARGARQRLARPCLPRRLRCRAASRARRALGPSSHHHHAPHRGLDRPAHRSSEGRGKRRTGAARRNAGEPGRFRRRLLAAGHGEC